MLYLSKISRLYAPALAMVVLLSSLSYSIDLHFCQGNLKSFSLFGKAKNCHEMASKTSSCHQKKQCKSKSKSCDEKDNDCCNNKTVSFESDLEDQLLHIDFLDLNAQSVIISESTIPFDDLFIDIESVVPFAHYKPPLIQKDIPVLFETYLL